MVRMDDVYFKVGSNLAKHDFDYRNVELKKELVDVELKKYLVEKINEMDIKILKENLNNDDVTTDKLVDVIGGMINEEEHFDTLRHLTHFIINIAGEMQGYSIIWWNENEEEYRNLPVANFNEEGLWDSIHTHEDDSYVRTFKFVYDIFTNKFMKSVKVNKKVLNN